MEIAVLGWGSLIWDPRQLKITGTWKNDGPYLPIEFARVSRDKRLTLVLLPGVPLVKTLWIRSNCKDLKEVICNLANREGTPEKNIGFVSIANKKSRCNVMNSILSPIKAWTKEKHLDAVVWTDLPSTFKPFNFEKALDHLRKLNGEELDRAEIYVRKTPEQIRTKLRTTLEKEFGWTYIKNE